MLRMARHVHRETGLQSLCLAGGVALNCVANGRILREGPFENSGFSRPRAMRAGRSGWPCSSGTNCSGGRASLAAADCQHGSCSGPPFADEEIQAFLDRCGARYEFSTTKTGCAARVADCIAEEKVVGWFQGRMEFGPRALGARSILGDARSRRCSP